MTFTLVNGLEPGLLPDPEPDAGLLVGVGDCVTDAPIIPCTLVETEPVPPAVDEAVGITKMAAVPVGGSVFVDLGVEVGPPGLAVSVGISVPVKVAVGVHVGTPGMPVAVGVRPNGEQSGALMGVAFGSGVFDETRVLVVMMGVFVGTKGVSAGTSVLYVGTCVFGGLVGFGGSVGASVGASGSVGFGALSPRPRASPTPEKEVRQITPRIQKYLKDARKRAPY